MKLPKWLSRKPTPENHELLQAMHAVAKADVPRNRDELYRRLMDCWFYIPVPEVPDGIDAASQNTNVTVTMAAITDKEGRCTLPVFSDDEALRNWDPNTPFLKIKSRTLFQRARDASVHRVLINPFDPIRKMIRAGGFVSKFEIDALADGLMPKGGQRLSFKNSQSREFRAPQKPLCGEALAALRKTASELPEVQSLYLAEVSFENGPIRSIIGVGFGLQNPQRRQDWIEQLGMAATPFLRKGESLDFVDLGESSVSEIKHVGIKLLEK